MLLKAIGPKHLAHVSQKVEATLRQESLKTCSATKLVTVCGFSLRRTCAEYRTLCLNWPRTPHIHITGKEMASRNIFALKESFLSELYADGEQETEAAEISRYASCRAANPCFKS